MAADRRSASGMLAAIGECRPFGSARTGLRTSPRICIPSSQRETLWPGTVYADPYGHVLVLVEWVPQTAGRRGILLAADAQPDNSVSRKRSGRHLPVRRRRQRRAGLQGFPAIGAHNLGSISGALQ